MSDIRQRFPLLQHKTYLNSCSYGALEEGVEASILTYLRDRREHGACWEKWVAQLEILRGKTAELLGADADEIAIVPSLTAGFNALVSCLDFSGKRNKVVATSFDFPTTAQIWHAQKRRGADIVMAPLDDAADPRSVVDSLVDERTLVVSVPWICYRNGRRLDIATIAKLVHSRGALLVVDAYQGVGTMPCDVSVMQADVLLGGYLKYLMGTAGVAYMYVKSSLVKTLEPTTSGWFAQENVHAMAIAENVPAASARRFEGGTPDVAGLYACIAGLDVLAEMGVDAAARQVRHLTELICAGVLERGWELATGDHPHGAMLALRCHDMVALVERLGDEGVVVSCRDGNVRISPHFYNNEADITALFKALEKHRDLLD
ncbi:MAG: aminotransferase class V-fold PLP-dependent enzyme [Halioglobus sp.]|nr:aminotransferase class V-fold PLP-dependent enzyme [Halioglobus sp.]